MAKSIRAAGLLTAVMSPVPNAPALSNRIDAPTVIPSDTHRGHHRIVAYELTIHVARNDLDRTFTICGQLCGG